MPVIFFFANAVCVGNWLTIYEHSHFLVINIYLLSGKWSHSDLSSCTTSSGQLLTAVQKLILNFTHSSLFFCSLFDTPFWPTKISTTYMSNSIVSFGTFLRLNLIYSWWQTIGCDFFDQWKWFTDVDLYGFTVFWHICCLFSISVVKFDLALICMFDQPHLTCSQQRDRNRFLFWLILPLVFVLYSVTLFSLNTIVDIGVFISSLLS
jgi:hypothetical protein